MHVDANTATWGVVLTASEPKDLILAQVAHHLQLGASEVYVFLDTPEIDNFVFSAAHDRCHVVLCDANYWKSEHGMDKPPARHTRRQSLNAAWAQARTEVAWLLNIDADEFLWCTRPFGQILAGVPERAGWLKLMPSERRRRFDAGDEEILAGQFLGLTTHADEGPLTEGGFTGHVIGKSCVRMGRGYTMTIHNPRIGDTSDRKLPPAFVSRHAELLHFEGITPLHWASKLLRRARRGPQYVRNNYAGKRRRQIFLAAQVASDLDQIKSLQRRLTGLSAQETAELEDAGILRNYDLQIERSITAQFPGVAYDLSTQGFDAKIEPLIEGVVAQVLAKGADWSAPEKGGKRQQKKG